MSTSPYTPPKNNTGRNIGIGCAVLFLLLCVAVFIGARAVKHQMDSGTGPFAAIKQMTEATTAGMKLQKAIVAYKAQHRHYPAALSDVIKDGLVDGKTLHSSLDPDPRPMHISWHYTRPAENAPPETPILSMPYHMDLGSGAGKGADGTLVISLNGKGISAK